MTILPMTVLLYRGGPARRCEGLRPNQLGQQGVAWHTHMNSTSAFTAQAHNSLWMAPPTFAILGSPGFQWEGAPGFKRTPTQDLS